MKRKFMKHKHFHPGFYSPEGPSVILLAIVICTPLWGLSEGLNRHGHSTASIILRFICIVLAVAAISFYIWEERSNFPNGRKMRTAPLVCSPPPVMEKSHFPNGRKMSGSELKMRISRPIKQIITLFIIIVTLSFFYTWWAGYHAFITRNFMYEAVIKGDAKMVKYYIETGMDPGDPYESKEKLLTLAEQHQHKDVVRLLKAWSAKR